MEKSKSVLFYTDWARPLQGLPLEDVGRLFYAILNYTETGNPQTFDSPAAAMAFPKSEEQLASVLRFCREVGWKPVILFPPTRA